MIILFAWEFANPREVVEKNGSIGLAGTFAPLMAFLYKRLSLSFTITSLRHTTRCTSPRF